MGLLQKACETYDCHAALAGKLREGHETLAPISFFPRRTGEGFQGHIQRTREDDRED